jgi:hypothetical protein
MAKYRDKNRPHWQAYKRRWASKLRQEVIVHYGGRCICCGETNLAFLVIDHKDGGGNKHRKQIGGGTQTTAWIKRNGFPDMFQILCANCNSAKGAWGQCPHEAQDLSDAIALTGAAC